MATAERNNVRIIRGMRPTEIRAWQRWFPRRRAEFLIGRYCRFGGYIVYPGGRGRRMNQPAPTPGPTGGGGQAA